MNRRLVSFATLVILGGCSLAPEVDFQAVMTPPAAYKHADAPESGQWASALPAEAAERGAWWSVFSDETLDELVQEAAKQNPSLQAAAARMEQARALARAGAVSFLPDVSLGADAVRAQPSSASVAAFGGNPNAQLNPYTIYSAQAVASYEIDLFGRVRDGAKALESDAKAQAAAYQSLLLMLQADVAQHYFSLRSLDAERERLQKTVTAREEAVRILKARAAVGDISAQEESRGISDLASVQAELSSLSQQRDTMESALAVLLGQAPAEFTLPAREWADLPPAIPGGVPSALIARRPDVAASMAAMAAANARIGVARTAFLPRLTLTASGGGQSQSLADLLQWSSRTWALGQLGGSALAWSLFESGRDLARVDAAQAAYEETLSAYRAQVLAALREADDHLSAQRALAEQHAALEGAATAAARAADHMRTRHQAGDVDYLEVVESDRAALAAERAAIQARGRRFVAAVGLIRALGGGWDQPPQ